MKKMIMGLAVVLMLGGGAAGGYFYFMKPAEAAQTEGEIDSNAVKQAERNRSATFEFVELQPLILPIIDENGVSQTVSLVIAIEVADAKNAAVVNSLAPRLKDAFIQDMYGLLNRQAALKGGVIQVNMIKERLNQISARVLGDDVVQDVLLQVVQQRPI
ncbi:MAG: flagellar basal body-associated FliL family protein [Alphaproteobacteria bacterium]